MAHMPKPVLPGNVAISHTDYFILSVVAYTFEEDASSEGGYLNCLDLHVGSKVVPRECTKKDRDAKGQHSVEIEDE